MKVIIFGATGGIGRFAVKHALKKEYEVVAYVRNSAKMQQTHSNLQIVEGQMTEYEKVKSAMAGCDAVINAIGISMKPGFFDIAAVEANAMILRAMKECKIKRYIIWSTPSIPSEQDVKSYITVLPGVMASLFLPKSKKALKKIAYDTLSSGLDWTIVRFMAPQNSVYTGNVKISYGKERLRFAVSREDIGAFMVDQIENTQYLYSMPIIGS